jgi:hypothetical protein
MDYKWKEDPFFMIVPHLSIPNVHFVFRKLSPTAYLEIEFEIKNRLIYPDSRLTDSENEFISKNLI